MRVSKELNSPKARTTGSGKLFIAKVAIAIGVLMVWFPFAAALSLVQPLVSIIFIIGWVIFWATPVGQRLDSKLFRIVNGG